MTENGQQSILWICMINSIRLIIESDAFAEHDNTIPIIYGQFDNNKIGINWDSTVDPPSTLSVDGTLHITETAKLMPLADADTPTCGTADAGLLYFDREDATLKVCDGTTWQDLH